MTENLDPEIQDALDTIEKDLKVIETRTKSLVKQLKKLKPLDNMEELVAKRLVLAPLGEIMTNQVILETTIKFIKDQYQESEDE